MWKEILAGFRSGGLCEEAFQEALIMLKASHAMHVDAVSALHEKGVMVADIYERDRHLNKYERNVRRKILTHFSVSPKPDLNMGLVVTSIVIDIERIGDYTKNIVELAVGLPEEFDGGELAAEFDELERVIGEMFENIVPALEGPDEQIAREIIRSHKSVAGRVERGLQLLRSDQVLKGRSGQAVTAALYLRYLKRVSAHLRNIATSVVNPFHRIGFKEKRKKKDGGPLVSEEQVEEASPDDLEPLDEDEEEERA
jgi:phosphate uptake regulator